MIYKTKIAYLFSMGVIVVAIFLILICGFLAFVPVRVVEPQVQPYRVLTQEVSPGDTLIYEVDVCKFRNAPTQVVRRFVDEEGLAYPLAAEASNIVPGCSKVRVPVIVPSVLHTGKWHLTLDVSYRVNPLRTESYHLVTERFNVTE